MASQGRDPEHATRGAGLCPAAAALTACNTAEGREKGVQRECVVLNFRGACPRRRKRRWLRTAAMFDSSVAATIPAAASTPPTASMRASSWTTAKPRSYTSTASAYRPSPNSRFPSNFNSSTSFGAPDASSETSGVPTPIAASDSVREETETHSSSESTSSFEAEVVIGRVGSVDPATSSLGVSRSIEGGARVTGDVYEWEVYVGGLAMG